MLSNSCGTFLTLTPNYNVFQILTSPMGLHGRVLQSHQTLRMVNGLAIHVVFTLIRNCNTCMFQILTSHMGDSIVSCKDPLMHNCNMCPMGGHYRVLQ